MTTGDLEGNIRRLKQELKRTRYSGDFDEAGARLGIISAFIPIIQHALLNFSRHISRDLLKLGIEMRGCTDKKFVELAFKASRQLFDMRLNLTIGQMLEKGFTERKILFVCELISQCVQYHNSVVRQLRLKNGSTAALCATAFYHPFGDDSAAIGRDHFNNSMPSPDVVGLLKEDASASASNSDNLDSEVSARVTVANSMSNNKNRLNSSRRSIQNDVSSPNLLPDNMIYNQGKDAVRRIINQPPFEDDAQHPQSKSLNKTEDSNAFDPTNIFTAVQVMQRKLAWSMNCQATLEEKCSSLKLLVDQIKTHLQSRIIILESRVAACENSYPCVTIGPRTALNNNANLENYNLLYDQPLSDTKLHTATRDDEHQGCLPWDDPQTTKALLDEIRGQYAEAQALLQKDFKLALE